jgi:hypothetical protein
VSRVEEETAAVLGSAHEDVEGFARNIALLEDKLAVEHRAWEKSEREHLEQFGELTHLQT